MVPLSGNFIVKLYFCFLILGGCNPQPDTDKPSKVTLEQNGDSFSLFVNNERFYIKGAGGSEYFDKLAEYGGTSIRTWSTDNAEEILDEAQKHGIMVTIGLWVGHERHGFNYNNEDTVQQQLENFRSEVERYKDHPALLMWAIGNEYELNYTNTKVWNAVNDIAKMIKEVDPNHPTMTIIAEINSQKIQHIKSTVTDIDILGVNSYGGVNSLPKRLRDSGWNKPYLVTEWGPNGHWEVDSTAWGAPLEQSSTEKREVYLTKYQDVIFEDSDLCLGSYVFLWGFKQEVTPTWYGLFLPDGSEVETLDAMYHSWMGEWPVLRAPSINDFTLNEKKAAENVYLVKDKVYNALMNATHQSQEVLNYEWVILKESNANSTGGDFENRPDEVTDFIVQSDTNGNLSFVAPSEPGPYRLFAFVKHEASGKTATANIPFFVN